MSKHRLTAIPDTERAFVHEKVCQAIARLLVVASVVMTEPDRETALLDIFELEHRIVEKLGYSLKYTPEQSLQWYKNDFEFPDADNILDSSEITEKEAA